MKNKYIKSSYLAIVFSTGFLSLISGQTNSSRLSDHHPFLIFEGSGFNQDTRIMNFSTSISHITGRLNERPEDNGITIQKDGLYRISVSGNIHENDRLEQKEEYIIYINGKEITKGFENQEPPTGVFSFEALLTKGDILSIGISMNEEDMKKISGQNILTLRLLQGSPE